MQKKLYPGDFLIADPSILGDASFHRAVVLICGIEDILPWDSFLTKPMIFL